MRLLRVQISSRKTVIYHPSFADVWKRIRCMFGWHEFEMVLEYPSVGAKEDMCIHCLKERYTVMHRSEFVAKTPNAA